MVSQPEESSEIRLDSPARYSDDGDLIARCKLGDQQAFAQLVRKYRHIAWTVCREITSTQEDAEDALQEALTAVWQNIGKFRGDSRFSTWLYRVATNAALSVRRRRRETPIDVNDVVELESTAPLTENRTVTIDAVRRAIADLPEEFQVAIVLCEFADLSYADIAEHQGIPVQTVKTRIHRARQRLTEALTVA